MTKRTVKAIEAAFKGLSAVAKLKAEIELLTRCSGDTVYRLRYDTMRYDYISSSVTQLLGYTVDELMQINLRSLILETRLLSEGLRPVESYAALEETRKRGEVNKWQADYLMKTRDGREIWVSDVSTPWFGNDGAIIGSCGSLRDITDRILAEAKTREELLHLGGLDTLTGLGNRELFWGRMEEETRRVRRTQANLSLLLITIDSFPKITEAYGEDLGQTAIADIARLMHGALREIDLAARLGDEEFAVILPETNAEGAARVAARIRDSVARHTFFAGSHNQPVGCTVSIGVASVKPGQNPDAAALYKLADMRLYIARHTGEGQISTNEMAGNFH